MRALALLVIASLALADAGPPRYRVGRGQGRVTRCDLHPAECAAVPYTYAAIEVAPPTGLGMPSVACDGTAVRAVLADGGTVAETFTRASVAECYSNDGQTLTQVGSGVSRVSSGSALSSWMGPWAEPAMTGGIKYSRDLSQDSVWTKTNMTCVRDAAGMRGGDANGASTCTATAPNATVCQTVTTAAATRTSSWHLKRSVGTGAVTLARDASTYSSSIAASLSSTIWRRAVPSDTPGCAGGNCIVVSGLTGSVLNPQVCLKLATSGDAVVIDFVQDEPGDKATSPMDNGAAVVARAAEVRYFTHAAQSITSISAVTQVYGDTAATAVTEWTSGVSVLRVGTAISNNRYLSCTSCVGGSCPVLSSRVVPYASSVGVSVACAYGPGSTDLAAYQRGALTSSTTGNTPAASTRTYVGSDENGTGQPGGVVKGVRSDVTRAGGLWTGASTGTPVLAMVGDSITAGFSSSGSGPPVRLGKAVPAYVADFGVPGATAADCLTNYRAWVAGHGYTSLILLCGVNSLSAGATAVSVMATLTTIMDEARAAGLRVTPMGITPWKNAGTWTAPKQTQTDALNVLIAAYATANGLTYVDPAPLGGEGGDPAVLLAAYDSGDHIHPTAAGNIAIGALLQAANP